MPMVFGEFADSQNQSGGKYYGYRVHGPQGNGEMFDSTLVLADPYSQAVVSAKPFHTPGKTLILPKMSRLTGKIPSE